MERKKVVPRVTVLQSLSFSLFLSPWKENKEIRSRYFSEQNVRAKYFIRVRVMYKGTVK